jgi:hypothetical protein
MEDGRAHERIPILEARHQQVGDSFLLHGAQAAGGRPPNVPSRIVGEEQRQRTDLSLASRLRGGLPDSNVRVFEQRPGRILGQTRRVLSYRQPHEPIPVLHCGRQQRSRLRDQACHRAHGSDPDVWHRIG